MAVDKTKKISFFHGKKDDIQSKIDDGTITESDFVVTSDTDEYVYIDSDKSQHVLGSSKSKEAHTANLGAGGTVGGIKNGDTIDAGTDIDTLIKKIITKQVPPTYSQPNVTLGAANVAAGSYEYGTHIKTTLTASFTQNDAGSLTSIAINDGTNDILTGTSSPLTDTDYEFDLDSMKKIHASATFKEGAIKNDNLGEPYSTGHVTAKTITSSDVVFTPIRFAFYGSGAGDLPNITSATVRALGNKYKAPSNSTAFKFDAAAGDKYIIIAYPASITNALSVNYVQGNDPKMADSFEKHIISVEGANGSTGVDYNVYSYELATPSDSAMTFEVTL